MHAYRDTVAAAYRYRYRYRGPVWVDDIDPVWITVAQKGSLHSTWHRSLSRTVMIPSDINRYRSLSRTVIVPSDTYR